MSDQLFIVLRVCLLALVYLVFLRVLRAVWVELRAEAGASAATVPASGGPSRAQRPPPSAPSTPVPTPAPVAAMTSVGVAPARLVIVAPPHLAGHTFAVDGETTIGRGAGCAVAIDDNHVSKLHARVYPHEGLWLVEDLGSTNGTALNGNTLTAPTPIVAGSRISIGEIALEFA